MREPRANYMLRPPRGTEAVTRQTLAEALKRGQAVPGERRAR
jgi:hypothetical protein